MSFVNDGLKQELRFNTGLHSFAGSFPIFRLLPILTKFWWMVQFFYADSNGMFFFLRNEK